MPAPHGVRAMYSGLTGSHYAFGFWLGFEFGEFAPLRVSTLRKSTELGAQALTLALYAPSILSVDRRFLKLKRSKVDSESEEDDLQPTPHSDAELPLDGSRANGRPRRAAAEKCDTLNQINARAKENRLASLETLRIEAHPRRRVKNRAQGPQEIRFIFHQGGSTQSHAVYTSSSGPRKTYTQFATTSPAKRPRLTGSSAQSQAEGVISRRTLKISRTRVSTATSDNCVTRTGAAPHSSQNSDIARNVQGSRPTPSLVTLNRDRHPEPDLAAFLKTITNLDLTRYQPLLEAQGFTVARLP
ncbi:hypothetical protein MSAN_02270500 [Mycena sanguinolenta]|uniref:Uncharacterized protein n=1 Tax=Mycena sanguinolenta TaxID=230812 RepID=A0A8H6XAI0_9AGAR|nr:hypothetical protein MSAN_02270500 [Mycena sanguinolenta]